MKYISELHKFIQNIYLWQLKYKTFNIFLFNIFDIDLL